MMQGKSKPTICLTYSLPDIFISDAASHISPYHNNRFDQHRRIVKMIKAIQILSFLLLGPLVAPAQTSFPGDKERERICKELVRHSSLVLAAIPASEPDEIVDRSKLKTALATRPFDVSRDYVSGRIFHLRVVNLLRAEGQAKKNDETVKLFVSGGDMVSSDALNVVEP